VLGVLFTSSLQATAGWVVAGSGHWIYEGTKVRDGDVIAGIVGHETDRCSRNPRQPTPEGTEVVARSPVVDVVRGPETHEAAVHPVSGGGFVFAAGTIQFVWGLAKDGVADPRVQRMTENVLRRAGLEPANGTTLQRTGR
jgi:hypothetical protein